MTDCLVIGSGPAGISAALTLKANGISFRLVGLKKVSVKVEKAEKISNYPGLFSVSGAEFKDALLSQLAGENIEVEEEHVTGVYAMNGRFVTLTESGKSYESKTVILCVGVETAGKIEGEEAFVGRGVSYCATCDGALYKGKTIAVVATSAHFEGEVEYLSNLAEKTYFMPIYKNPRTDFKNTEILRRLPVRILGGLKVNALGFQDGDLPVDGVFFLKESVPTSALVGGLKTENGHVEIARDGSTNLLGLFAAGDCTGRPYQYAKAVGEGNVAAHSVTAYLRERKEK